MSNDFIVEIKGTSNPAVTVATINGELDELNIERLKENLDPFLNGNVMKKLVLDFTDLQFINSKGIGYLVSVHTHLARDGRVLVISSANQAVMDVITLVGLTSIIPYFTTVEEALT